MKRALMTLAALAAFVCLAGPAMAVIGWAGNVWPNSGTDVVPTGPVAVYAQVWKDGVTPGEGQGAGIEAFCDMSADGGTVTTVAMTYNGEVGNNDEYTVDIPQSMLIGAGYVEVHVKFHDTTDDTWWVDVNDQADNPPPQRYNVVDVLPVDIDVTFTLCMSGVATTGAPCVIGSAPEIGSWTTGVTMAPEGSHPDLWVVTVTFAAGGNPSFEYKYKKDDCTTWEDPQGNRPVTLPTDGTDTVVLPPDSWTSLPIGCGLGEVLDADRELCLQVCLEGVDNSGGVCVTGSLDALTNWGNGVPMIMIGPDLYQACVVVEAGTPIPLTVEYKFKKDDCNTWEGTANRSTVVDNSVPGEQTLTSTWEDGPGSCSPVPTDPATWGVLKSLYR
jgi:hypothetical protein